MPTRHNDGTLVQHSKYWETAEAIVERFGAVTWQPEILRGIWVHHGERFEEENIRFFVDIEDTDENSAFFADLKSVLKERFGQIDIWITSHEIRIT